ncbi:hypothetical protein [Magnetococcus sp. PR-3]|uniref:hypothetical protein n=1 Tax=Magnetococcus sp. PR-3 TaxID=3120355 RepID=UPI002FCDE782
MDQLNKERTIVTGRWALLVFSPREAALTAHYEALKGNRHPMHNFSTLEAAEPFLNMDLSPYIPHTT